MLRRGAPRGPGDLVVASDPSTDRVAIATAAGATFLYRPDGRCVGAFQSEARSIEALAFSADGRRLAARTWDERTQRSGTLMVWDIAGTTSATLLFDRTVAAGPAAVALSADGRTVLEGGARGRVTAYDIETGAVIFTLAPASGIRAPARSSARSSSPGVCGAAPSRSRPPAGISPRAS